MHDYTKPYNILTILMPALFAIILFATYFLKASQEMGAMWAGVFFVLLTLYRIYAVFVKK